MMHVLILCPRGFANERKEVAIPAGYLISARNLAARQNPEGHVSLTRVIERPGSAPEGTDAIRTYLEAIYG